MEPELRQSIQETAFNRVHDEYRQEVVEEEWMAEINELLATSTAYSLNASNSVRAKEVLIRSDAEGLSSISFPSASPGDNEPVPKVAVELFTASGNLVREASAVHVSRDDESPEISISFMPIRNSRFQEFVLRFIPLPEEIPAETSWIPTSAYMRMGYSPVQVYETVNAR
jgi:hypothetical protein